MELQPLLTGAIDVVAQFAACRTALAQNPAACFAASTAEAAAAAFPPADRAALADQVSRVSFGGRAFNLGPRSFAVMLLQLPPMNSLSRQANEVNRALVALTAEPCRELVVVELNQRTDAEMVRIEKFFTDHLRTLQRDKILLRVHRVQQGFALEVPAHVQVFPHRVVPRAEMVAELGKLILAESQLSLIFQADPAALWLGAVAGDIVEIQRADVSGQAGLMYRRCVKKAA